MRNTQRKHFRPTKAYCKVYRFVLLLPEIDTRKTGKKQERSVGTPAGTNDVL